MWSRKYEKCIICGTVIEKHKSKGMCAKCYQKHIENCHKKHTRRLRKASQILTKEYIVDQYLKNNASLSDIARNTFCSRQYVYKMMKEYKIPFRSKSDARCMALIRGKVSFDKENIDGSVSKIQLQKVEINRMFFMNWSIEMAWVLGVIFTDGCINKVKNRYMLSVGQKEPEILFKILSLMGCNANIYHRVKQDLYYFSIDCSKFYDELYKYGLHPRKSLDIEFPSIPKDCVPHFIRGCWDGDGSVYTEKNRKGLHASYVSGSWAFINGLVNELEKAGFPRRTIYIKHGKVPSYYIRFSGQQCVKLFHFFYDNVPPSIFLQRKYDKFITLFN